MKEYFSFICWVPLDEKLHHFFGFTEFITALALMVLVWTTVGARYQFRIKTAPIPLYKITFFSICFIGMSTLLTNLWYAEKWYVPAGDIISPAVWEAILGGWFFLIFLLWIWFAFIRPSRFSRWNAKYYEETISQALVKSSSAELPEIAEEVIKSSHSLIKYSWGCNERPSNLKLTLWKNLCRSSLIARDSAFQILTLIADRRFCRYVVQYSPITVFALMEDVVKENKYNAPLDVFSSNITTEALNYRDSFIYRERSSYTNGSIGLYKPITRMLYGNYKLVDAFFTLNVYYKEVYKWDSEQLDAYFGLVLMSIKDFIKINGKSYIYQIPEFLLKLDLTVLPINFSLNKISEISDGWHKEEGYKKFEVYVEFLKELVRILNKYSIQDGFNVLGRNNSLIQNNFYDYVACLMFNAIYEASTVKKNQFYVWQIQHNLVWSSFFGSCITEGKATNNILSKLQRLIYFEIKKMDEMPNFKSAAILGMVLNVMGMNLVKQKGISNIRNRALHRAVIGWTRRNFGKLLKHNYVIAQACLVDGLNVEKKKYLVKTYLPLLGESPNKDFLLLDDVLG